jgi:broad specificity phosphatase PhoE
VRDQMSDVFLIRHGQASFGAEEYDALSPIGVRQSHILAGHLVTHGIDFDAVYCGRLKRQRDTARAFCGQAAVAGRTGCEPTMMAASDEYDARGLLLARTRIRKQSEGMSAEDLPALMQDKRAFQTFFAETVYRWLAGEYDDCADVEPWRAFCRRVTDGLEHILARHRGGKRVAVFTSGGAIAAMIKMALGLSDRTTVETGWQIMNASLTCIKHYPAGLALSMFNNTTHLLLEKDPCLLTYR